MSKQPIIHSLNDVGSDVSDKTFYMDAIHRDWIDIDNRVTWIHGVDTSPELTDGDEPGVEYQMASKVIKNLHILETMSRTKPVTIRMMSCGGLVEQGLAIYDTIKLMPYPVTIINYTHARSMSSYILQAADERVMLPHSHFMFHTGEAWAGGLPAQLKSTVEFMNKHDDMLMKIYVDQLKKKGKFKSKPRKWIADMITERMQQKVDVYLLAKEAVAWGFADRIITKF
jgi:ATP-dependent Clp protease protease subunit